VKRFVYGLVLVLTFVAVGIAAAPPLTFTFSDVKANGKALETDTYGVNDAGAIAGDYVDAKMVQHAMILAGTKLTTVNIKGCSTTAGTGAQAFFGINKTGVAAGWCNNTTGIPVAFTWAKGKTTFVKFPKAVGTELNGINDKGDVVGIYFDSANVQHGFSKIGGKFATLDVKGGTATTAWGITNLGQVTLYTTNAAGAFDAYLVTGKKFKKINNPNAGSAAGQGTIVHTPNNKGDIDGTYYDSTSTEKGWLFHGGKYFDVVDPNGVTRADGLNDKLEMVGRYGTGSFGGTGFKATTK
jgi:hypothetical protein